MAEDLTEYMHEQGIRVRYMHSDIETLERIEIIRDLRLGAFDVLIGINLLREGLDIPECALVAILDADKEGFLRSETSLDPDHRPRRPQRRRQGHPLRRPDDRLDAARHRRDRPPPREADGLQHGQRHHAREHQAQHPRRDVVASTSRTTSPSMPASPRKASRWSATTSRPSSTTWKRRCARRRPTSSSRPPRACATRSSACARPSSPSPTIPSPARPTSRTKPAPSPATANMARRPTCPVPPLPVLHGERVGVRGSTNRSASFCPVTLALSP